MILSIYLYIYQVLIDTAQKRNILNSKQIMFAINKVIRRAPRIVLRAMIKEIEALGMIKTISDGHYLLLRKKCLEKELKRINKSAFPINI